MDKETILKYSLAGIAVLVLLLAIWIVFGESAGLTPPANGIWDWFN